jgi:uncharacterized damage-inducible protein DinB
MLDSASMDLLPTIREMFDHNYWARDQQLRVCAGLDHEQLGRPLGGSFPTLHATLVHLVAVEWLWLERWRGRSPKELILPVELPTLAVVTERWTTVEAEMRGYLAALDEDALARPLSIVSTRGEQWTYPLWRMLMHLLNHQSFHRGQVTTLLRMLGAQPPRIDFLVGRDVDFRP